MLPYLYTTLVPSPGTPGEGQIDKVWGEGDFELREVSDSRNHPHPDPLPEYREREKYGPAWKEKPEDRNYTCRDRPTDAHDANFSARDARFFARPGFLA
jgi:hypothetical protein